MNYIKITHNDIANGPGVRTVLWVSGCSHNCEECQNPQTWDPAAGIPFDNAAMTAILSDLKDGYRSGVTFSGGDPLFEGNRAAVEKIAAKVKETYPNTETWLYTGYCWEDINDLPLMRYIDVLVDGPYEQDKHDITLHWKGSSNQRVVDVQRSRRIGAVVLWNEDESMSFYIDRQDVPPVAHCAHCRGEIYGEDTCYIVGQEVICDDCLEDFEKETRCGMSGYELDAYLNHLYGGLDDIE